MRWWRTDRDVDEVARRTEETIGKVNEACNKLEETIAGIELVLRVRDAQEPDDET